MTFLWTWAHWNFIEMAMYTLKWQQYITRNSNKTIPLLFLVVCPVLAMTSARSTMIIASFISQLHNSTNGCKNKTSTPIGQQGCRGRRENMHQGDVGRSNLFKSCDKRQRSGSRWEWPRSRWRLLETPLGWVGCNRKDKHEEQIAGLMRTARGSCQKLKETVIDLETMKRSEDGWVTEATYPKTMYDLMHSLRTAIIQVVKLRKMTCWPRCEDGGSVAKTLNRRVDRV